MWGCLTKKWLLDFSCAQAPRPRHTWLVERVVGLRLAAWWQGRISCSSFELVLGVCMCLGTDLWQDPALCRPTINASWPSTSGWSLKHAVPPIQLRVVFEVGLVNTTGSRAFAGS